MASLAEKESPELENQLKINRARREKLKLQILASISVTPKPEEAPTTARTRRMTSEMVLLGMTNIGINLEVDVSGLSLKDALRLRFLHHLAKLREDMGVREKQQEEIVKMKEMHEKSRSELKIQRETSQTVRSRVRRMRRILQTLQTRLVASTLALQFQMTRKIELTQSLENINYYRDTMMENALAFLFGRFTDNNPVPLGGVFSPYAYIDYDDEEDRLEKEQVYMLSLTPASFKSSAQSRRASFRHLVNDSILTTSRLELATGYQSVEYSSLLHLQSFSQASSSGTGENLTPRRSGSEDAHALAGNVVAASVIDSSPNNKRIAVGKGLKPSMSDRPTKHEIGSSSSGKKTSPGIFSIFKNR
jgi:hypothetical protein